MDFSFKQALGKAGSAMLGLFYPPLCVHCHAILKKRGPLLCSSCLELLSLVEILERCRTCFSEVYRGRCERCIHRPAVIHRQMAACEAMGPAFSMLQGIHDGRRECIRAAASLMAYQWLQQKLPLADVLIPLPVPFWKKQKTGMDFHCSLALEVGKVLGLPVLRVLKRKFESAHFLTSGEIRFLPCPIPKKAGVLCDRRILVIALQLDDGLLRHVGFQLQPFFPARIEALAFAVHPK